MYKVLLVDDEIWSLEGLRKLFNWEEMGFRIIAEATDAAEAFEIICEAEPDLVITDIRMPEISGIELLGMTRKRGIQSEFVIVSGYAEFEYAKEALRLGAYDYQLKPIDVTEAIAMLGKLRQHLDAKRIVHSRRICDRLTAGFGDPMELLDGKRRGLSGEWWQVVSFSVDTGLDSLPLSNRLGGVRHILLHTSPTQAIVICNGGPVLEQEVTSLVMNSTWDAEMRIGVSSISQGIDQLSRLIRESEMAICRDFVEGTGAIVRFHAKASRCLESVIRKIEKWIMLRNHREISGLLDTIPQLFAKESLGLYHAEVLWNQFAAILNKRTETGEGQLLRIEFLDYEQIVNRYGNLHALCKRIGELAEEHCTRPDSRTDKQGSCNENFKALLRHVNSHYQSDLSLGELAERFYLNMTYCSELFKKVTGHNFSDYVTKLRMEKAAELMESGTHTIDEVCERTGYHDYYYFNKIFKKFYGVTPSQFAGRTAK